MQVGEVISCEVFLYRRGMGTYRQMEKGFKMGAYRAIPWHEKKGREMS